MNAFINFASKLILGRFKTKNVFNFNGGVHPHDHKNESTKLPISKLKLPEKLVLPLRQHVGNIPKVRVQVGDLVLKGQLLAEPEGSVSAAIHAPTSGIISAISEEVIPHPSGLPDLCITLVSDGNDTWDKKESVDWRHTEQKILVEKLRMSGIVGLGGATFPTHIKLRTNGKSTVHTLIINAAECEPYITCDDMLMREQADEIVKGIEIVQYILGTKKCLIGIEDNKPQAAIAMRNACINKELQVKVIPTLYPSGDARRLIHLLLNVEVPNHMRSTDVGIQVFNVATVLAIYRYFEFGEPAINRVVTITGNVATPQNYEVLFGTPLNSLIQAAGGAKANTTHFIMGGPMMGFDLPNDKVPITKAANCIIAVAPKLFAEPPAAMPCIRCARCADACPVNLQPQELYWFSKSNNFEKARDYNLFDCIECGCCSYVCPSDIPLVQYYRYAKSEIISNDKAKEAADLARERNELRLARINREKLERAQKHAERAISSKSETKSEESNVEKPNSVPKLNAEPTQNKIKEQFTMTEAIEYANAHDVTTSGIGNEIKRDNTPAADASEIKAKQEKQALIAAAIERAKAQKLAATKAGIAPKNIDNVSASTQSEINNTEAIREKVKHSLTDNHSD